MGQIGLGHAADVGERPPDVEAAAAITDHGIDRAVGLREAWLETDRARGIPGLALIKQRAGAGLLADEAERPSEVET